MWNIKCLVAEAIIEGLKAYEDNDDFVGSKRKPPLVVELDSVEVVAAVNRASEDATELGLFVEEIDRFRGSDRVKSFSKCSRHSNSLAHELARAASKNDDCFAFVNFSPSCGEDERFWWEVSFPDWCCSVINALVGVTVP